MMQEYPEQGPHLDLNVVPLSGTGARATAGPGNPSSQGCDSTCSIVGRRSTSLSSMSLIKSRFSWLIIWGMRNSRSMISSTYNSPLVYALSWALSCTHIIERVFFVANCV